MSDLPRFKHLTRPDATPRVPAPVPAATGIPRPPGAHRRAVELSLCMIVRDEETRLGECLHSIRPFVDEMVVVDTGSRDRTPHVAAECGARVFQMPWPDSFADARNESLAQARGRWIFWMDADDVLSPECGPGLRQLVRNDPHGAAAYQVQVRIPPGPGEFSASVVDHVKLFPNRPDLRFEHRIHEQILPAVRRAGLEVRFSDLYVTHQNYDRSEAGQEKKRRRDFRLLELDLRDRPDHPFVLFNLGMTYLHATKEFEVAAHYLRRSLDHSHPSDSIVRKAYAMLTTARICQGEWELAIQANEEGRTHYPDDAELLFQAGQVYQQLGRFDLGRLALERLVTGQEDPYYRSVDVGLRTYRARHELALLYRRMGDGPHCAAVLREIAEAHPGYLPAQVDLAETLYHLGEQAEAYHWLRGIPPAPGLNTDLARLRGGRWSRQAVEAALATPKIPEWQRSLEAAFVDYVPAFQTHAGMSISPAVARLLWVLAEERKPRRILELGAGFSSYVLRLWAARQPEPVEVWSVDDSPEWLEIAARFLQSQGLPTDRLFTWEAFRQDPGAGQFDLVMHDLGNHEVRMAVLDTVVELTSPGGLIVLDDLDWAEHRERARQFSVRHGFRYQELRAETLDEFGRFSGLLELPPFQTTATPPPGTAVRKRRK